MSMSIHFQQSIICKLGGYVDSNPELLISYPPIEAEDVDAQELIALCLPFGCKAGDMVEQKYKKNILLSYVFTIEKTEERDDLLSFAILVNKKQNVELYKSVIQEFISHLDANGLLNEEFFENYQELIYSCFNEEKNIEVDDISIPLSDIFMNVKNTLNQSELSDVKGSFF